MEPEEYDNIARLEARHWWYVGMRAAAEGWIARLAPGRPLRILDAGCGTGGGLRWLAAYGTVTGIDLHPRALAHARAAAQPLARASVMTLPFASNHFDLVTSFDVLYHQAVSDDTAALREAARVLRPGGWLVLRVPAYDRLRGAHDRQVHTRHRYARPEVRRKLAAVGLEAARVTHAGLWLLPAAGLRRAVAGRARARSDVRLPPAWLNRLLAAGLRWEARWLAHRDLPAGLSVLALARKAGGA